MPGGIDQLLVQLRAAPRTLQFQAVLATIDTAYTFHQRAFANGPLRNNAGTNAGSLKIIRLAQLRGLSTGEALSLYGEHWRELPAGGTSHANIRQLLQSGLNNCRVDGGECLEPK